MSSLNEPQCPTSLCLGPDPRSTGGGSDREKGDGTGQTETNLTSDDTVHKKEKQTKSRSVSLTVYLTYSLTFLLHTLPTLIESKVNSSSL